jgi:hypothetical protein
MRLNYCLIVVACGLLTTAVADEKWTFEDAQVGTVPQGWLAGVTGAKEGAAPRWEVRRDEGRNLLAQLESGGARSDFPVCLKAGSKFKDGTVSVRLKPISGSIDQAGGVVFRASDRDNFYIVRANALENNISIYVTRNGKRETIKYWENIEVGLNQWHELRVEAKGFTFKVWLNDNFVGEIKDANQTFPSAGMVGVWTKADSVTYFDTLAVSDDNSER